VHFLKYFKQYLLGRYFTIRTDHAALTWLRRTPDPIGQQSRWLEILEEYDFVIEHRPGIRHGNADAMSRKPCIKNECYCKIGQVESSNQPADPLQNNKMTQQTEIQTNFINRKLTTITEECETHDCLDVYDEIPAIYVCAEINKDVSLIEYSEPEILMSWSWDDLQVAQQNDKDIACILDLMKQSNDQPLWKLVALKSQNVKTLWNQWPRLQIKQGILKRRFEEIETNDERWQIVLPHIFREEFLRIAHSGMTGGHLGKKKMEFAVQQRAYWPSWSSDLRMYINSCEPCAQYHRGVIKHQALMQTDLVGEPWERLSIDITGCHPTSLRSRKYILTVVDHFSKWAEAIPLTNHTAPTVAKALMMHVFSRFGTPKQILTDRGPEFESEIFSELMRCMEIDKLRCVAYKPSTNAIAERFHRTLNSMLGKVVSENQRDWDEKLHIVMAAYRASIHNSTGFSPNKLFLGREIRMPLDLVMGIPDSEREITQSPDQYIQKMMNDVELNYELAREQLRVTAERRKKNYDMKIKEAQFKIGDWVWYYYPRRYLHRSPKWQRMYTGPFLVTHVIAPVNFVLQKSVRSKPFVTHIDKIKKCNSLTPQSWLVAVDVEQQQTANPMPIETIIANPAVEKIKHKLSSKPKNDENNNIDSTKDEVEDSVNNENNDMVIEPRLRRGNRKMPSHLKDFVM